MPRPRLHPSHTAGKVVGSPKMNLDLAQQYLLSIPMLHIAEDPAWTLPQQKPSGQRLTLTCACESPDPRGPDILLAESFLTSLEVTPPSLEADLATEVAFPNFVPAVRTSSTSVDSVMRLDYMERRPSSLFKNLLWWKRRKVEKAEPAGTSYKEFLVPSKRNDYDLNVYDTPAYRSGSPRMEHETSLVDAFMGWTGNRAKEEANEAFQKIHPELDSSITLSKLRNLQKDLVDITTKVPSLDMVTVALAWVYFEMLLQNGHVIKSNRKLFGGACLVLAYKFNQDSGESDETVLPQLARCIQKLDRKDRLNLAALQEAEVKVFVFLEFGLSVSPERVKLHLQRMVDDFSEKNDWSVSGGDSEDSL